LISGNNPGDLPSFWILYNVLSPTFFYGYMTRYNNGYTAVNLAYLCFATAVVIAHISATGEPNGNGSIANAGSNSSTGAGGTGTGTNTVATDPSTSSIPSSSTVYWPFVVELSYIFLVSAVPMCITILYGVRYNANIAKLPNILRRASVQAAIEQAEVERNAKDTNSKLKGDSGLRKRKGGSNVGGDTDGGEKRSGRDSDTTTEGSRHQENLSRFLELVPEISADVVAHAQQHPAEYLYHPASTHLVQQLYAVISFLITSVVVALIGYGHITW
jgi:hypothetical protein